MPYVFIENAVMVSHTGITNYNVYRNNFAEGDVRQYLFTTNALGCEDDDDAFDIREMPGYDDKITTAANLVNMICDGVFGPIPDDYDSYIEAEDSEVGHCPVCNSDDIRYGTSDPVDGIIIYPFKCDNCGAAGNEYGNIVFDGFRVDWPAYSGNLDPRPFSDANEEVADNQ
jgi:hypothetical protein